MSKTKANLLLLAAAMIWGAGFIFSKQATDAKIPVGLINGFRGLIFALFTLLIFYKEVRQLKLADWKIGLIAGTINFLGYQVQTLGLKETTPANNAFLTATYILMIPLIGWLVFKKAPDKALIGPICLSIIGMLFLTNFIQTGFHLQRGDALTLLCAFIYAIQIIYFGISAKLIHPWRLSFMLAVCQSMMGFSWSLLFERAQFSQAHFIQGFLPIIFLGIFSSFIGQSLQLLGQRYTDESTAGLILMNEALFGSILSVIFGFEPLSWHLLFGGIMIMFAILLTQLQSMKTTN